MATTSTIPLKNATLGDLMLNNTSLTNIIENDELTAMLANYITREEFNRRINEDGSINEEVDPAFQTWVENTYNIDKNNTELSISNCVLNSQLNVILNNYSLSSHQHSNYALTSDLNNYALKNHTHDYAPSTHRHDNLYMSVNERNNYSLTSHNHDLEYAARNHDHNTQYSSLNHDHDERYSQLNHDHAGLYSDINHNHNDLYASIAHNHDGVYAKISDISNVLTKAQIKQLFTDCGLATGTNENDIQLGTVISFIKRLLDLVNS